MRHKHDCTECVALGTFGEYDLYYCEKGPGPTLVARYGSDPWEYTSGLVSALPALTEARRQAVAKGLIDAPQEPQTAPVNVHDLGERPLLAPMTREQAMAAMLADAPVVVFGTSGKWWLAPLEGTTPHRKLAHVYSLGEIARDNDITWDHPNPPMIYPVNLEGERP